MSACAGAGQWARRERGSTAQVVCAGQQAGAVRWLCAPGTPPLRLPRGAAHPGEVHPDRLQAPPGGDGAETPPPNRTVQLHQPLSLTLQCLDATCASCDVIGVQAPPPHGILQLHRTLCFIVCLRATCASRTVTQAASRRRRLNLNGHMR